MRALASALATLAIIGGIASTAAAPFSAALSRLDLVALNALAIVTCGVTLNVALRLRRLA